MKKDGTGMQINSKQQETKLIIVTREDISNGYQSQQSTHSVAEFAIAYPQHLKEWSRSSGSIICLAVKTEQDLLKLHKKLSLNNIDLVLFQEPDLDNEFTSLCFYANYESRKLVSHLPLLGKNKSNTFSNSYESVNNIAISIN